MKSEKEIKNEIKRLKTQVTKIKNIKDLSAFKGFGNVMRIVSLENRILALKWVIDNKNKLELGFNLKTK